MAELEIRPTPKMRMRAALIIAVGAILCGMEMYLLAGGLSDVFSRRTTLTTYMADSSGITTDSEVRLSGLHIGDVSSVELSGSPDPQKAVRVQMRILTRYLKDIPADSQTDVNADTIVSDKYMDIAEGKSPLPIAENAVLPSEPMPLAKDRGDLMQALQDRLKQMDQLLSDVLSPNTDTGKFLLGESEYDTLVAGIGDFNRDLQAVLNPQTPLGQAIFSPELYNKGRDFLLQVDRTLVSIQNGEGTAGHLFASDEQYNDLVRNLRDIDARLTDANMGRGGVGSFLQDDEPYMRLVRLLRSTNATLASFNAGENRTGQLLSNAQLYESLNGSLRKLAEMLRDVREDPSKYLRVRHKIF